MGVTDESQSSHIVSWSHHSVVCVQRGVLLAIFASALCSVSLSALSAELSVAVISSGVLIAFVLESYISDRGRRA